jgi:hypothetical protein
MPITDYFSILQKKRKIYIPSDGVGDLQHRYCDYCNDLLSYEGEYDHQKKRSITNNHHSYCPIKTAKKN